MPRTFLHATDHAYKNCGGILISIIILNWNGKKDTIDCLESLEKVEYDSFKIYLVDNGSTDDSVEVIQKQFPKVELVETGKNLGFAGGNNAALRQVLKTNTDYIFLLNNDTVVNPGILDAFVQRAKKEPRTAWGAKLFLYDLPDTLDHLGGIWDEKQAFFRLVGNRKRDDGSAFPDPIELDYICGAALFVPKKAFEEVGLLDERFFLIWEEADWCMRAKRAGFKMRLCPEAKLFHKVSASFQGKAHHAYFSWRNRLLFIEKNFSGKARRKYMKQILFREAIIKYKHLQLRRITRRLGIVLRQDKPHRKEKIQKNRAILRGIRDYVFRRFGDAPKTLYKK